MAFIALWILLKHINKYNSQWNVCVLIRWSRHLLAFGRNNTAIIKIEIFFNEIKRKKYYTKYTEWTKNLLVTYLDRLHRRVSCSWFFSRHSSNVFWSSEAAIWDLPVVSESQDPHYKRHKSGRHRLKFAYLSFVPNVFHRCLPSLSDWLRYLTRNIYSVVFFSRTYVFWY